MLILLYNDESCKETSRALAEALLSAEKLQTKHNNNNSNNKPDFFFFKMVVGITENQK